MRQLLDAHLVVVDDALREPRRAPAEFPPSRAPLVCELRLTRYSDLEDLLKLDPIHDVDEAGWPVAKSEG